MSYPDQTVPTKPEAAVLSTNSQPQSEPLSTIDLEKGNRTSRPISEFDPCSNPHFCSPFYNHDSPRVSSDHVNKNKTPIVQLYALTTQTSSTSTLKKKKKPCMTKPAQGSGLWAKMSKKQKLGLELLFALVLVGAIVGLAVGISKRVGGGVVKNDNQVTNIS
jgi:hypothetical protein